MKLGETDFSICIVRCKFCEICFCTLFSNLYFGSNLFDTVVNNFCNWSLCVRAIHIASRAVVSSINSPLSFCFSQTSAHKYEAYLFASREKYPIVSPFQQLSTSREISTAKCEVGGMEGAGVCSHKGIRVRVENTRGREHCRHLDRCARMKMALLCGGVVGIFLNF